VTILSVVTALSGQRVDRGDHLANLDIDNANVFHPLQWTYSCHNTHARPRLSRCRPSKAGGIKDKVVSDIM
jgi:hypothetical protein